MAVSGVQCILLLLYEAAQQCHSEGLVQGSLRAYFCGLDDCSLTFEPTPSLPRFYLAAVEIYHRYRCGDWIAVITADSWLLCVHTCGTWCIRSRNS